MQKIPLNYTTVSGALPKFTWMDNSTIMVPITNPPEGVREINDVDLLRDPNANFTVWKVNLTDSIAQSVQTFPGVAFSVEFSPDGNYLTFRKNGVQSRASGYGKYTAFHKPSVKLGGVGESSDLMLADLNTGSTLTTLEANGFFAWSPYSDLYIYHQHGEPVDGIYPRGIFLGQIGKDPIFIKLVTGYPPLFYAADWVDSERFVMNVGCEISLVSLTYK